MALSWLFVDIPHFPHDALIVIAGYQVYSVLSEPLPRWEFCTFLREMEVFSGNRFQETIELSSLALSALMDSRAKRIVPIMDCPYGFAQQHVSGALR